MAKIKLRLPSWIAAKLEVKSSGWLTLEKEVGEGSTISDFLVGMVMTYPGFREAVYNPDAGLVNEQINVVLNDRLLTFREISRAKLIDGDTIVLLPIYYGG